MLVNTEKMIPVTKLQKELTQRIREISEKGEPLYVLRNNAMAAVIISPDEYETMKDTQEVIEQLEIAETIEKRLRGHHRIKNIPWEKVKRQHGL